MYGLLDFVIPKITCPNTYLAHISIALGTGGSQKVSEDALWRSHVNTISFIYLFLLAFGGVGAGFWVSCMVVKYSPCHSAIF